VSPIRNLRFVTHIRCVKKTLFIAALLFASTSFAQVTVNVSTPVTNATVASPFTVNATASSSHPITGWQVYVDGVSSYSAGSSSSISGSVAVATGTHQLVVRAWDSSGAYNSDTLQVTASSAAAATSPAVTSAAGLPTPPSTAKVFSNIDQMGGWTACGTAACAGGSGTSAYWQALNQTSPAMDGRSMEVYNAGVWANALWWMKFGANDSATNMLWDFYVNLDAEAAKSAQALEYDQFQFVGGYNYMIGTECNYAAGVWDTWNEGSGAWLHTTVPCAKFTSGTWHHIQMYVTTNHSSHTYTYKTFVIDGKSYTLNQTQPAKNLGWADNIGVQYQLDVNATGSGYHEWVDQSKLTIW
jgi:hypothetical protein